jgi:UDP-N-acetylglucosamine--N-acetylmuramyl-(pentapeptide) pyrophosphoryl-undecaprenol N-acetylglucosamine transferase
MKGAGEHIREKKLILTGGGTAGHITPLLAVAEELKKRNQDMKLVYIGHKDDSNLRLINESGLITKSYLIFAGKYRRYPTHSLLQKVFNLKRHFLNVRDIIFTTLGILQSFIIMIKLKPDAVFMKGGYVGVPVGLAAGLLRKKLVTHDSDVVPGLANRVVSPLATFHAVASNTEYPYKKSKTVVTGIPVRNEYYEYASENGKQRARKELGFNKDDLILFVGGSTQGARTIDDIAERAIIKLLEKYNNLTVIHVFGRLNEMTIRDRYKSLNPNLQPRLQLHGFLHDNYKYMSASDILVGRAGATFIAEASVLSSTCVIIPAPHLSGGHQVENARVLAKNKAVVVIEEDNLNDSTFMLAIEKLLNSKEDRVNLGKCLHDFQKTDASRSIVDLILKD